MKIFHCSDVGFKCPGVIRADSEEEIMRQASEHARQVHHVEVDPELARKVKGAIREEQV